MLLLSTARDHVVPLGESARTVVTTHVEIVSGGTFVTHGSLTIEDGGLLTLPLQGPARADVRRFVAGIRAWMVLPTVDALLLLTPALWRPQQFKAWIAFSLLSLLFITGGERFRARLHLSVLDELPGLIGRMLMAAAVVAT